MDPNLHQEMGIHHLSRVLDYSAFVAEDGKAVVHLTQEDWHVVADTLFRLHTPKEMLPGSIKSYRLVDDDRVIELETADCVISVDMM